MNVKTNSTLSTANKYYISTTVIFKKKPNQHLSFSLKVYKNWLGFFALTLEHKLVIIGISISHYYSPLFESPSDASGKYNRDRNPGLLSLKTNSPL